MLTAAAGTTREMRTQEGGRDIMRHADILNKLDEIIYVVDMESYELLYLNRAARSLCAGERVPPSGWLYRQCGPLPVRGREGDVGPQMLQGAAGEGRTVSFLSCGQFARRCFPLLGIRQP